MTRQMKGSGIIPIDDARRISEYRGVPCIVMYAIHPDYQRFTVTTFGSTPELCRHAASLGEQFSKAIFDKKVIPVEEEPIHLPDSPCIMKDPETWLAWLIERRRGGTTLYASFDQGGVEWTQDALKACHFVRRSDAEQMAYGEDCDAICEHQFGLSQNAGTRSSMSLDEKVEADIRMTTGEDHG